MGTAERRLEILKYLCKYRRATMPQLAEMFDVSVRTIQRDILEIETTFRVPLDVRCGKYDGGVFVVGDYTMERMYMSENELEVLLKVQEIVISKLSDKENSILDNLIKKYSKPA